MRRLLLQVRIDNRLLLRARQLGELLNLCLQCFLLRGRERTDFLGGGCDGLHDFFLFAGNSGAPAGDTPNLFIGANPQTGDQNREWLGGIDDVAQYDRVLTGAEILQIYDGGVNGQSLGALISSSAIPEPGSATLMLLGLVGLGLRRKR